MTTTKTEPTAAHTSGTWTVCPGNAHQVYKIETTGSGNDCYELAQLRGPDRLANARLMSAAPELLEALRDATERLEAYASKGLEFPVTVEKARRAIAKATGC